MTFKVGDKVRFTNAECRFFADRVGLVGVVKEVTSNGFIRVDTPSEEIGGNDDEFEHVNDTPEEGDKLTEGVKYDEGKPAISLSYSGFILGTCDALGYGARKYEKHNYRKGYEWTRALDAALRHILAELEGEEFDEESGLEHWKHAAACLSMYAYFKEKSVGIDDRYKPKDSAKKGA